LIRLNSTSYDLLASEARLGSYVAIAKGDIDTRHWFRLGRTVTAVGGRAALLSWSGSMFEYLMPMLVMRQPTTGLLATSCELAVRHQIQYAKQVNCPVWGISEAGLFARDPQMNYQYSPFGVPGLGLVRGLSKDLVIAPYATGLATMIDPAAALGNYAGLARLGARGRYGYYEALDFTGRRLPEGSSYEIVRSYMAHHQGMTIVAIANVVLDGLMRDRFHDEPLAKATELLLEERAPEHVPTSTVRGSEDSSPLASSAMVRSAERVFTGEQALAGNIQLMSNGRLNLKLNSAGAAWLRWQGLSVTRWSPDRHAGMGGDHLYVRDADSGTLWSAAALPMGRPAQEYQVRFSQDRARYAAQLDDDLHLTCTHQLSPETDAVVRRLVITNRGLNTRRLDVASYLELVLGRAGDDQAHPAFSKMFISTEFRPEGNVLLATRRRRSPDDPQVWAAHFVQPDRGAEFLAGDPVPETDRRNFIGRGRDLAAPQMLSAGGRPSGTVGYTLDPIFSLTQQVVLPPGERI
jgi:cyclic beta-1,2-glucan synthetase